MRARAHHCKMPRAAPPRMQTKNDPHVNSVMKRACPPSSPPGPPGLGLWVWIARCVDARGATAGRAPAARRRATNMFEQLGGKGLMASYDTRRHLIFLAKIADRVQLRLLLYSRTPP